MNRLLVVLLLVSAQVVAKPFAVNVNLSLFEFKYNRIVDAAKIGVYERVRHLKIKRIKQDPLASGTYIINITNGISGHAGIDDRGFINTIVWSMDFRPGKGHSAGYSLGAMIGVLDKTSDKKTMKGVGQCLAKAVKTTVCTYMSKSNKYLFDYLPDTGRMVITATPL